MNSIKLNLALAVFWLFLGGAFFVFEATRDPQAARMPIPLGWLALALAAYNLFRVWLAWTLDKISKRQEAARQELRRNVESRHPEPNS